MSKPKPCFFFNRGFNPVSGKKKFSTYGLRGSSRPSARSERQHRARLRQLNSFLAAGGERLIRWYFVWPYPSFYAVCETDLGTRFFVSYHPRDGWCQWQSHAQQSKASLSG